MVKARKAACLQPQVLQLCMAAWCAVCTIYVLRMANGLPGVVQQAILAGVRPVVPPLVMFWLWGLTVRQFKAWGVEYELCFAVRDRKHLMSGEGAHTLALLLASITASLGALMCKLAAEEEYTRSERVPLVLYLALFLLVVLPLPIFHPSSRLFFLRTVQRVLMPLQEVSWADFLLADIFCSLARSSADFSYALCVLVTGSAMESLESDDAESGPSFEPPSASCSLTAGPQLLALCLPYIIRFVQCLIVYHSTRNTNQLWNSAKYASCFPGLVLSALKHSAQTAGRPFPWMNLWLLSMLANSLFSFYWDVEQDWKLPWISRLLAGRRRRLLTSSQGTVGMPTPVARGHTSPHPPHHLHAGGGGKRIVGLLPVQRPDDAGGARAWHMWAVGSNLVLRFLWLVRLVRRLEVHEGVGLGMELAEVWRRHQWVDLRIATEMVHVTQHGPAWADAGGGEWEDEAPGDGGFFVSDLEGPGAHQQ